MQSQSLSASNRRGAAAILVVASIFVFVLMVALSIDVAYMQLSRLELRASTDAAAKAGAEALLRFDTIKDAQAAAKEIAKLNMVGGSPLNLANSDIEFGRSNLQADGTWQFTSGQKPFSAVRVQSAQPVSLFFGGVTGKKTFSANMAATAAFNDNEICLVVDRSHSMCFDLSGMDFSYPPAIPKGPPDPVVHPPDSNNSRWAYLELAYAYSKFFVSKKIDASCTFTRESELNQTNVLP